MAAAFVVLVPKPDPMANELQVFLPEGAPTLQAMRALQRHFGPGAGLSRAAIIIERQQPSTLPSGPSAPDKLAEPDLIALEELVKVLRQPLPPRPRLTPPTDHVARRRTTTTATSGR